ncbi:MAG: bile acid:sodium symporter [Planctomycetota bacterium]
MWKRYWFLISLFAIIPVGLAWPEGSDHIKELGLLPYLVGCMLLISGFTLDTSRLVSQSLNWKALTLGLSSTYIVAPLFAYGIARVTAPGGLSNLQPGTDAYLYVEAIMIAAAQSGTLASSIALTNVARGNQELALVLTVASSALTAFLTPLVLEISLGAVVALPLANMVQRMVYVVLVPVIVGQIARRFLWESVKPAMKYVKIIPQIIILLFVYRGFGAAANHLTEDLGRAAHILAVCAALHGSLIGWTWITATLIKVDQGTKAALVFCGSQKTLPNGIFIWEKFFATNPFGAVPLALYHLFQLVVDTFLVPWLETKEEESGGD